MKKKKHDPELLLVSFCDIVTVTMASLFMVLVVVIDQSSRTPTYRPTPVAVDTHKAPVYFECRGKQVYPIRREDLAKKVTDEIKNTAQVPNREEIVKKLQTAVVEDDYYRADPVYGLMGELVLEPRENISGEAETALAGEGSAYRAALKKADPKIQSIIFLVRNDSYGVFLKARGAAADNLFSVGWELLDDNERVRFGLGGGTVLTQ
jgi:hypothetical protein